MPPRQGSAPTHPTGARRVSGPRPPGTAVTTTNSNTLAVDGDEQQQHRPSFISDWATSTSLLDQLIGEEDVFKIGPDETPPDFYRPLPQTRDSTATADSDGTQWHAETMSQLTNRSTTSVVNTDLLAAAAANPPGPRRRTNLPSQTLRGLQATVRDLEGIEGDAEAPADEDAPLRSDPSRLPILVPIKTDMETSPQSLFSGAPMVDTPGEMASSAATTDPSSARPDAKRKSRGPSLSVNTTLELPTRPQTPPPISPGLKRWQQVRDHVMALTPVDERSGSGVPVAGKKRGIVSKAAQQLGFRHVVEDVMGYDRARSSTIGMFGFAVEMTDDQREEASRQRRRFARDVKTCLDACALEETNRRLQRVSQASGSSDMTPQAHKARSFHHLGVGASDQKNAQAQQSNQSVHTGPVFSAFAPLLTELHRHLPDARAKAVWSRTCPHHAAILAELGVTFLPDSASTDGERAQALEVFGVVVRNWSTDSPDEELDRWLWLCHAMLVDDRALRSRGLDLLAAVLRKNPTLPESFARPPTAGDFETLAIALIKLLHALENAPYPSQDQVAMLSDLIRDISTGDIISVDPLSLELLESSSGLSPTGGIERELLWMAAGRAVGVNQSMATWMLDRNAEVLKRFAPAPMLHATPPLILQLRVDSAIQIFASFSSIIRSTSSVDLISLVADEADFIYNSNDDRPDPDGKLTAAYVAVLLGLTLKGHRAAADQRDPFAASMQRSGSAAQRMRLLNLLNDGPKDVMDRSAEQLVSSYPISLVMDAVRTFLDSDLVALGCKCVPLLLKRFTMASTTNPDAKHFLVWLAARHPQLFYKPLFTCAAATNPASLTAGLKHITALSAILGPVRFWMQADPQMVVIVLLGDIGPRTNKGKGKEGDRSFLSVKLGRFAMLVEFIVALGQVHHVTSDQRTLLTTLETKLGTMLEVEEKEGELPLSYRSLVCQVISSLRNASSWTKRTAAARLAVAWYAAGDAGVPNATVSVDVEQLTALRTAYRQLDASIYASRLEILDIALVTSLSKLLVTIQASLSIDDWGTLLPILWERYAQPDEPVEEITFLLDKCAEQVPAALRNLVTTNLLKTGPERFSTLLKLAMLYGYRFQVLSLKTIAGRGGAFRFQGRQLEYIIAEVGSPDWVVPRDAHDAALQKYGRSLPLELRQRLMELGWSEDDTMGVSDYERVPVTLLPPTTTTEKTTDQRAPTPAPSPTPSPAKPQAPALTRTASSTSVVSVTGKTRRALLAPLVTSLIHEQARLLLDSDDVAMDTMSYEIVRMLEREDPALFARPATEILTTDMPNALTRLNAVFTHPTPGFAYVSANSLIGFLKFMVRRDPEYRQWPIVLSTIARIIPYVSEMSLRDIRKSKAEHVLLPGSIYDDETGFKLHLPWQQDILEVQSAQLIVLAGILRTNPRDVYIIKKMLFNLQVQASFTNLTFARAWIVLIVTLFSSLNSNYNDRAELRHFLHNIGAVIALHGTTDVVVAGQAMRALSVCAARFRRLMASIGFVQIMRVVYDTYTNANRGIRDAIEYACRSFYRIHQDVFVYQLSLAIAENPCDPAAAYNLISCLSNHNRPKDGVPSGIRGLNDKQEMEALIAMVSGGAEVSLSELGTRAEDRRANRATKLAALSLEPTVFPQDNIIRLFVTVIAINAGSPRSIKLLKLFTLFVPFMNDEKSKELLPDAIDAIGRFVGKGRVGDDEAMLRFLPGEENATPDWMAASREYVLLVDAFASNGGHLNFHVTKRLLEIIMTLLHGDPKSVGPTAASILGSLARTNLAGRAPNEFLRNIAPAYRQHLATIDFSGILEAIVDLIKRSRYQLHPELTSLIVNDYVHPAIRMLAMAAEENLAFKVPLRSAVVDLLAASVFLPGSDALSVLEDVACTPGLLAAVILPLCLIIDRPQDMNRDELYSHVWVRLLRIVLKPKRGAIRGLPAKPDDATAYAATAVLSLQTIKVIVIRAPECIATVRGLWSYTSANMLSTLTDGNGKFYEPSGGAPAVPRVVDWMLWSLFELLALHRTTLNVTFKLRIQTTLASMQANQDIHSRPSSAASDGPRSLIHSPMRSLSGFVRRPSCRVPPSPGGLTPGHARTASASTHSRVPSGAAGILRTPPPGETGSHVRAPSDASGGTTPTPGHAREASSSTTRFVSHSRIRSVSSTTGGGGGGPSPLIRPSFAALSARRASRPVFDAFSGPARTNRFPSSAPIRSLGHGQQGTIVHLLGPATQVVSATGATIKLSAPVDPTRAAIRKLRVNNAVLVGSARRAVATTMAVYGYEPENADNLHVWGITEALHIIAEETKVFVEDEFHDIFNPPHVDPNSATFANVDFSEKRDSGDSSSVMVVEKRNSTGSDESPSFGYTLQPLDDGASANASSANIFYDGSERTEVVVTPVLSISQA